MLFIGCSNGTRTVQTINNDSTKTRLVIETVNYGTGGGLTGTGPNFVKEKTSEYDSLNNIVYQCYKETSCDGCFRTTKKWDVQVKNKIGNSNLLELLDGVSIKLTYQNKDGKTDSIKTIPYSVFNYSEWLHQSKE